MPQEGMVTESKQFLHLQQWVKLTLNWPYVTFWLHEELHKYTYTLVIFRIVSLLFNQIIDQNIDTHFHLIHIITKKKKF